MNGRQSFHKRLVRALVFCAGVAVAVTASAAATVQVFNPQGEAKNVRQVLARFSEPMVAFGDPRLADPFTVQCEGDAARLKGTGRWADTRNWSYDFAADLPAGQRCRFTLKPEVKSASGAAVEAKREFAFHTGGPAVVRSYPHERDESIDEEQAFLLALDAPVDPASLKDAWCEAAGVNERIPVKLLGEKETREILAANRYASYDLFNVYRKGGPEIPFARFKVEDKRWRDAPVIAVRCAQRLPADAEVKLVIGPQVKTRTGIERAKEQRLAFKVRPAFIVKLTCQRANTDAACLPVTPITIDFNAPVPRSAAEGVRLKSKDGKSFEATLEPSVKSVERVEFRGPFPEKAALTVEIPRDFKDDAGREPQNKSAFPLSTGTDEYPPLAKFPGRFGILELNADPLLPVTVRNVEPLLQGRRAEPGATAGTIPGRSARIDDEMAIIQRSRDFMRGEHRRRAEKVLKRHPKEGEIRAIGENEKAAMFEVPRTQGEKDIEVIGIPLKKPGYYIVELASPRLGRVLHGEEKPYYVSTSVLVTNLAVHLKHGRESSLVWVTSLDGGKPVPDARVTVRDCTGKLWFEGRTDASGIANAGDRLPPRDSIRHCGDYRRVLVAFARVGEDLSFTYSDWDDGIQTWNYNLRVETMRQRPLSIHTVMDRSLFRTGETVSMKHLARTRTGSGFRVPASTELPGNAQIEHIGSGQKYKLQARFDANGIAESTWAIPPEAKLGYYELTWVGREFDSVARFRVEAFRVPLMRAVLAPPKLPAVRPSAVELDAAVTYLSGGPATNLSVKVRSRVEPRGVHFRDYSDFQFGGVPVKEGIEQGSSADLWNTFDPDEPGDAAAPAGGSTAVRNLTLDGSGTAKIAIDKLPTVDRAASLVVEMEYSDPNGEILAVASSVPLHPAAVYVGIKPEGWTGSKKAVRAQLLTLDASGKPLAGRSVNVDVYERKRYSHRRRLVGGFYAFDSTTETKRVSGGCSGTTDAQGLVFCTV